MEGDDDFDDVCEINDELVDLRLIAGGCFRIGIMEGRTTVGVTGAFVKWNGEGVTLGDAVGYARRTLFNDPFAWMGEAVLIGRFV